MNRRVLISLALIGVFTLLVFMPIGDHPGQGRQAETAASARTGTEYAGGQAPSVAIADAEARDAGQDMDGVVSVNQGDGAVESPEYDPPEALPSSEELEVLFRTNTTAFYVAFDHLIGVEPPDSEVGLANTQAVSDLIEGLASDATALAECGGKACVIDVWLTEQTILEYLEELRQEWVPVSELRQVGRSVELQQNGSYRIYTY
ncbi:MAG: hypothetical protein AAF229_06815 [Pseudomonadota bacterium]